MKALFSCYIEYYVAHDRHVQYGIVRILCCILFFNCFNLWDLRCQLCLDLTDASDIFVPIFLLVCSLSAVSTYNNDCL